MFSCQFAHGVQELRPSVDSDGTNASQDPDRAARPSRDSQGQLAVGPWLLSAVGTWLLSAVGPWLLSAVGPSLLSAAYTGDRPRVCTHRLLYAGDRPRVCWNWANAGNCKFGSTCTYASTHTSDNFGASVAVPVCRFWSQKGYCPYGSK